MEREQQPKDDGRYIIFYTFKDERITSSRDKVTRRKRVSERTPLEPHRQRVDLLRHLPPGPHVPSTAGILSSLPHEERERLPATEVPRSSYGIVVFENKFPSFIPEPPELEESGSELTPTAPGRGVCEVVLYTDDHYATLAEMDEQLVAAAILHVKNLIDVWADRYVELGARDFVDYVFIFENKGEVIGVTLVHPHGHLVMDEQ